MCTNLCLFIETATTTAIVQRLVDTINRFTAAADHRGLSCSLTLFKIRALFCGEKLRISFLSPTPRVLLLARVGLVQLRMSTRRICSMARPHLFTPFVSSALSPLPVPDPPPPSARSNHPLPAAALSHRGLSHEGVVLPPGPL